MRVCLLCRNDFESSWIPSALDVPAFRFDQNGEVTTEADPTELEGQDLIMVLPLYSEELLQAEWRPASLFSAIRNIRHLYGEQTLLCVVLGAMTKHGNALGEFLGAIRDIPRSRLLVLMDQYIHDGPRTCRETAGNDDEIRYAVSKVTELLLRSQDSVLLQLTEWRHVDHVCLIRCVGTKIIKSGASAASQAAEYAVIKSGLQSFIVDADQSDNGAVAFWDELESDIEKLVPAFDPLLQPDLDVVRDDVIFMKKHKAIERFAELLEPYRKQARYELHQCQSLIYSCKMQNARLNVRERIVHFVKSKLMPGFGLKSVELLLKTIGSDAGRRIDALHQAQSPRSDLALSADDPAVPTFGSDDLEARFAAIMDKRPGLLPVWLWCFAGVLCGLFIGYGSYRFLHGGFVMRYRPMDVWMLGAAGGSLFYLCLVAIGALIRLFAVNRKKMAKRVRLPLRLWMLLFFGGGGIFVVELLRDKLLSITMMDLVIYSVSSGLCIMLFFMGLGFYRYARQWFAWKRSALDPFLKTLAESIQTMQDSLREVRNRFRTAALKVVKFQVCHSVASEAKAAVNSLQVLFASINTKLKSTELAKNTILDVLRDRAAASRIISYSYTEPERDRWFKDIEGLARTGLACELNPYLFEVLLRPAFDEIEIERIVSSMIAKVGTPYRVEPNNHLPKLNRLESPNGIYTAYAYGDHSIGGYFRCYTQIPDEMQADPDYAHIDGVSVANLHDVQFAQFFFDRWLPMEYWQREYESQIKRLAPGGAV